MSARPRRVSRLEAEEDQTHADPEARIDQALAGLGLLILIGLMLTAGIVAWRWLWR